MCGSEADKPSPLGFLTVVLGPNLESQKIIKKNYSATTTKNRDPAGTKTVYLNFQNKNISKNSKVKFQQPPDQIPDPRSRCREENEVSLFAVCSAAASLLFMT